MSEKPNIIFIAIDTLRYDHLGCNGYNRNTSPNIDKWLAANGIVMQNHFTTTSYTHPAFTSIFTGNHPLYHGVVYQKARKPLVNGIKTLPELFKQDGYYTCGVDSLGFQDCVMHFRYGYDKLIGQDDCEPYDESIGGDDNGMNRYKPIILSMLEEAAKHQPFYFYIHIWDPHRAYLPRNIYKNMFLTGNETDKFNYSTTSKAEHPEEPKNMDYTIAQYDASIYDCDEALGHLFQKIDSLNLDNTLTALTADHGESLGEHNIYTRHAGIYDVSLHVPFIVRWKGKIPLGKHCDALTSHVDIAPTLLSLAGVQHESEMAGLKLDNVLQGISQEANDMIFGHTINPDMRRCVRTKKYKYFKQVKGAHKEKSWPDIELYNIENDPGEQNNIADSEPEICKKLDENLEEWIKSELNKAGHPDPMVEQSHDQIVDRLPMW